MNYCFLKTKFLWNKSHFDGKLAYFPLNGTRFVRKYAFVGWGTKLNGLCPRKSCLCRCQPFCSAIDSCLVSFIGVDDWSQKKNNNIGCGRNIHSHNLAPPPHAVHQFGLTLLRTKLKEIWNKLSSSLNDYYQETLLPAWNDQLNSNLLVFCAKFINWFRENMSSLGLNYTFKLAVPH